MNMQEHPSDQSARINIISPKKQLDQLLYKLRTLDSPINEDHLLEHCSVFGLFLK